MTEAYVVGVLGTFRVQWGGKILLLGTGASRLVALLVLNGDTTRGQVADLLWPNSRPAQSASNLRTVLWRLHRSAPNLLRAEGSALHLDVPDTDYHSLLRWIRQAIGHTSHSEQPPLGMGRELLPDWDEPWVVSARTELDLLRIHALEAAGAALLLSGRVGEACEAAVAAVALDPLRESATRLLIDVHLRGGNAVDALRCYQRFAELLDREIGARPGPAVTSLIAAHLGGSSAAAPLRARNQQRGGSRGAPGNVAVPRPRRERNGMEARKATQ